MSNNRDAFTDLVPKPVDDLDAMFADLQPQPVDDLDALFADVPTVEEAGQLRLAAAPKGGPMASALPEPGLGDQLLDIGKTLFGIGDERPIGARLPEAGMAITDLVTPDALQRGYLAGQQGAVIGKEVLGIGAQSALGPGDDLARVAGQLAGLEREAEAYPRDPAVDAQLRRISQAGGIGELFDVVTDNYTDTGRAMLDVALESAGMSVPAIATSIAGSAFGPAGAATGTGLGTFATEYTQTISQKIKERGGDPADPETWRAALSDQAFMEQVQQDGLERGIPIAVMDAISAGLAGRFLRTADGALDVTKAVGKEATVQGTTAGIGEVGAQIADTGEVGSVGDVFLEIGAEMPSGAVEVGTNVATDASRRRAEQARFEQAALAAATRAMDPNKTLLVPGGVQPPVLRAAPAPAVGVNATTEGENEDDPGQAQPGGGPVQPATPAQVAQPGAVAAGGAPAQPAQAPPPPDAGDGVRNGVRNDPGQDPVGQRVPGPAFVAGYLGALRGDPDASSLYRREPSWQSAQQAFAAGQITNEQELSQFLSGQQPAAQTPPTPATPGPSPAPAASPQAAPAGAGATPVQPPAAVPGPETGIASGTAAAGRQTVTTAAGRKVDTEFQVVDLASLQAASGYLQNRDRTRATSDLQIQNIAANLDPQRLGDSAEADRGAPIVGPDGIIESGNGRVAAIRRAYEGIPESAEAYRQFLRDRGYNIEGMSQPVLVRRRLTEMTPEERRAFVIESNTSATALLNAVEQARSDADLVGDDVLQLYRGGELGLASNRDFVRALVAKLPPSEQPSLYGPDGTLSQEGIRRVQNAMLALAYGDANLLSKLTEDQDTNIRSIGGAMLDVAGAWAQLAADVRAGRVKPEFDITKQIVAAAQRVSQARDNGETIQQALAQIDAFNPMDPVTERLIRAFYTSDLSRAAGREKIADTLRAYAQQAQQQTNDPALFGDLPAVTPAQILDAELAKRAAADKPAQQAGLFGANGRPVAPVAAPAAPPAAPPVAAAPAPVEQPAEQPDDQVDELGARALELQKVVQTLSDKEAKDALKAIGEKPRVNRDPRDQLMGQHPDDIEEALAAIGKMEPKAKRPEWEKENEYVLLDHRGTARLITREEEVANNLTDSTWNYEINGKFYTRTDRRILFESSYGDWASRKIAVDVYELAPRDGVGPKYYFPKPSFHNPLGQKNWESQTFTTDYAGVPANLNTIENSRENPNIYSTISSAARAGWVLANFAAERTKAKKPADNGLLNKARAAAAKNLWEWDKIDMRNVPKGVGGIKKMRAMDKGIFWGLPLEFDYTTEEFAEAVRQAAAEYAAANGIKRSPKPFPGAVPLTKSGRKSRAKKYEQPDDDDVIDGDDDMDADVAMQDSLTPGAVEFTAKTKGGTFRLRDSLAPAGTDFSEFGEVRQVEAFDGNKRIGKLVYANDGTPPTIEVDPAYRRKGVATAMLKLARQQGGMLGDAEGGIRGRGAEYRTPDGQAFRRNADEDSVTLTPVGREQDAELDEAIDSIDESPEDNKPQESQRGRGASPEFMKASFTNRPSYVDQAWIDAGVDPRVAANMPIDEQFKILADLIKQRFGIVVKKTGPIPGKFAVDNLMDMHRNLQFMAHVLGLPNGAMSLGDTLTLVMRKGVPYLGAMYHGPSKVEGVDFPAGTIVIPRRSNSFAHEWGHALDLFLTSRLQLGGGMLSALVRKKGIDTPPGSTKEAFARLMMSLFYDDADLAARVLSLESRLADPGLAESTRTKLQEQLDNIRAGNAKPDKVKPSQYRAGASNMGNDAYWANPMEMLARAFEAFVAFRVEAIGGSVEAIAKGDMAYLSDADARFANTFPKGDERLRIFANFDALFTALAKEQLIAQGVAAANPGNMQVMDPRVLDQAPGPKDEGGGIMGLLKGNMDDMRKDWQQFIERLRSRPGNPTPVADRIGNGVRPYFYSMRGVFRQLERRYKGSTSIRRLANLLVTAPGLDRVVGRTYDEATEQRHRIGMNRLTNIIKRHGLDDLNKGELKILRDILISERVIGVPDNILSAARELRLLLDKEWYANQQAGLEIGYTKNGYLPRILDLPLVFADEARFMSRAAEVYKIIFDTEFGEDGAAVLEKNKLGNFLRTAKQAGVEIEKLKEIIKVQRRIMKLSRSLQNADDPDVVLDKIEEARNELIALINEIHPEVRDYYGANRAAHWMMALKSVDANEFDSMSPDSKYTKSRKLPPQADKLLEDFYVNDPIEAIQSYLMKSARRTEFATRFGPNGEKLQAIYEQMGREGVSIEDQQYVKAMVDTMVGRNKSELPRAVLSTVNFVHAIGTITLLPRAVLSSVFEPTVAAIRTGNLQDAVLPFANLVGQLFKTANARDWQELARVIGAVSDSFSDTLIANRFGGSYADSPRTDALQARFFKRNFLHGLTNAQRVAIMPVAHSYLTNLAQRIVDKVDVANSMALLAELGVPDPTSFAEWLLQDTAAPTINDLYDSDGVETKHGAEWMTAMNRFLNQTIQNAQSQDRPLLAQNPVGRLIYGILSFSMAFYQNVWKRQANLIFNGIMKRDGITGAARYTALQLAPAVLALGVSQTLMSTIREAIFNPDRWEEWEKEGTLAQNLISLGFTRSYSLGLADPFIQAFTGLKYQRDLSNVMIGAGPGYFLQSMENVLQPFVNNSEKTNNTEYKAAQGLFQLVMAPAINAGLSLAPGGRLADPIYGIAMMYLSSPGMRDNFADMLVGEKDAKVKAREREARKQQEAAGGDRAQGRGESRNRVVERSSGR